jgi:predicted outer membrane repeat protein
LAGPSGSLVVTTLEDVSGVAGVNSLRDAVNYAYELDDAATITFAPSLFASGPATYVLSGANGPISIANLGGLLTLHGPGAGLLTFDGAGKSAVFSLASASVAMDGMTVANSYGSQSAIELTDSAILSVSNVVFVNNRTSGSGGAINARRGLGLSVDDCTFATNTASSLGGAIDVELAQFEFEVQNSTFVGNVSGVNEDGTTNGSAGNGGAINMSPYYGFRIVNCTFAGNRVFNGSGGALWAGNASASTVHQIADCTLTANAADGAGGGVEYVPNNGGVSYALTLDNSIISGDLAATNADLDINTNHLSGMSLTSQLVVTNNCLMGASVTNLFGTNTLADNGGATETIALNPNGPAINAGDNSVIPAGFTTDQAGQPRINDGTVDIGAYEFQFAAPAITSAGGVIFVAGVSNSFSITASGAPTPVVTVAGTLPAGVSFTNGVLAGTPPSGSSGAYALTLTATNGISPNTAQAFTLTVMGPDPLAIHPGFNTNGFAWSFNGTPAAAGADINNNGFTLTDAGIGGESRSGWFDYPLYVGGFQAAFTYQDVGGGGADGVAFVVQNSPSGRSALGGGGGDLGYVGVTPSVAVLLNLYSGSPGGTGWLLGTNGVGVYNLSYQLDGESYAATTPVNLTGGNPIGVNVRYLAGNLSLSLTDLVTSASFHTNVAVNLPAMIGTNVAYVGFTGGDGGGTSHQIVSNFSYAPLPGVAVNHQGTAVILSWPGSVYGFRLQSCAALSQNDWSFLASTPVQTNSLNQITIPIGPGAVFYRLFLPAP